jgi:hypothetical protein
VQNEHDSFAVGPGLYFSFENFGQVSGGEVLNDVILVDDYRHVMRETGREGQHHDGAEVENRPALHNSRVTPAGRRLLSTIGHK